MKCNYEYQEEYINVLKAIYDQITITDKYGTFIHISDSCSDNFGAPKEKIIGHSCYELEKNGILNHSVTSAVLKTKREITMLQETKGGRRLMVTGKPIFDENGELYRIINISHDVTTELELQKQLQKTEDLLLLIKNQFQEEKNYNNDNPQLHIESPLLIGKSEKMEILFKIIKNISSKDITVLLNGETGVGKSTFAKYIHSISTQKDKPFVQINCGAIPADLIEAELFGYAPGAFTGASTKGKEGLLSAAKDGTIFFDEISEIPLQLQVKLLHILQERKYMRIGDTNVKTFKARVIAASNKDLKELVKQGKFREDLYYRINVFPITIPSLRDRPEDIKEFINYYLNLFNNKYNIKKSFSKEAINSFQKYYWPGNVRELENSIERIVVAIESDVIDTDHIKYIIPEIDKESNSTDIIGNSLKDIVEDTEKRVLQKALAEQKTTRKIAKALGIDQSTVVKKLKKYNLK